MPIFNKNLVSVAIIILIVLMALVGFRQIKEINLEPPLSNLRTINVQGEGKTNFIPDIAEVSFSVISEGFSPKQVQDTNTVKMNAAIDYLKTQNINSEDIQTSGYFLNPKYSRPKDGSPFIIGYTLTQTIKVKIRDLDKTGEIIAGVVERGINQTGGLNFTIDDEKLEELKNEARIKAFEAAKKKAESMVEAVGVKLGKVVSFNESFFGIPRPIFESVAVGIGGGGGAPIPRIEPGSQEVAVSVNITYQIR